MPCFVGVVFAQAHVVAVYYADTLDKPEVSLLTNWVAIVNCDRGALRLHRLVVCLLLCRKSLFSHLVTLFFHVDVALLL